MQRKHRALPRLRTGGRRASGLQVIPFPFSSAVLLSTTVPFQRQHPTFLLPARSLTALRGSRAVTHAARSATRLPPSPAANSPAGNVHLLIPKVPYSATNSAPQRFTCQTTPPKEILHQNFQLAQRISVNYTTFLVAFCSRCVARPFMELPMKSRTDAADLGTFYLLADSATNTEICKLLTYPRHTQLKSLITVSAKRFLNVNAQPCEGNPLRSSQQDRSR